MKNLIKLFLIFMTISFIDSSNIIKEKENDDIYLIVDPKNFEKKVVESIAYFFLIFGYLKDLIFDLDKSLICVRDSINYDLREFLFLIEINKKIVTSLNENNVFLKEEPVRLKWIFSTNYFENLFNVANTCIDSNEKEAKLLYLFEQMVLIINDIMQEFLLIEKYFTRFPDYCPTLKNSINSLKMILLKRMNLLKSKNIKAKAYETKYLANESQEANISAHQLMGCCQDGKCGSLDGKKSQDKKSTNKNRKKKEKRKKKKDRESEEQEENEEQERNEQEELQGATGGTSKLSSEMFIFNTPNEPVKTFNKKKSSKQQEVLLKHSLDTLSKIIQLLFETLKLEQRLLEYIVKIRSIFEHLLLEKNKNHNSSTRNKLKEIINNEKLKYYLNKNHENINMVTSDKQKYTFTLKICSLSCKGYYENQERRYEGFCPHCICLKCKSKSYKSKNNIYSFH